MKTCNSCLTSKPLEEFNKNKRTSDGYQKSCRKCTKRQQSKSYYKDPKSYQDKIKTYLLEVKNWLKEYKQQKCCEKCGDKRWYILDFHHVDPKNKSFDIGGGVRKSRGVLQKELEKCIF
mgnify:CR=1 FL=1